MQSTVCRNPVRLTCRQRSLPVREHGMPTRKPVRLCQLLVLALLGWNEVGSGGRLRFAASAEEPPGPSATSNDRESTSPRPVQDSSSALPMEHDDSSISLRPADWPVQTELPDLLVDLAGHKIDSPTEWWENRRPELKRLVTRLMYGVAPPPPALTAVVTQDTAGLLDGRCRLREVELRFQGLSDDAPRIRLALFLPTAARDSVPVFVALNACGNATVLADPAITIDPSAWKASYCGEATRGKDADFWCISQLIDRGYAFATFHESNIDPDRPDFTDGIHPWYPDLPGPTASHWGTIAAWAWGLSRAADYLVTVPEIDPRRICVTGHSRRGKTALLAAALDERFALAVPHQSGTGGMALSRQTTQETVERINRVFPHWFNDVFPEFNDAVDRLPFDQHALVALVAPRPLLDTEGAQDPWANPPRARDSLMAADPVYRLLGAPGLVNAEPQLEIPPDLPAGGVLLQLRLDEQHTLNANYWRRILDFADRVLPAK